MLTDGCSHGVAHNYWKTHHSAWNLLYRTCILLGAHVLQFSDTAPWQCSMDGITEVSTPNGLISPCKNGAGCIMVGDIGYCLCLQGYQGVLCDQVVACGHRGCHRIKGVPTGECKLVTGSTILHYCHCQDGYTGPLCQYSDPCRNVTCGGRGKCVATSHTGKPACQCRKGLYGPPCTSVYSSHCHCMNSGYCVLQRGISYALCICPAGFTGRRCEKRILPSTSTLYVETTQLSDPSSAAPNITQIQSRAITTPSLWITTLARNLSITGATALTTENLNHTTVIDSTLATQQYANATFMESTEVNSSLFELNSSSSTAQTPTDPSGSVHLSTAKALSTEQTSSTFANSSRRQHSSALESSVSSTTAGVTSHSSKLPLSTAQSETILETTEKKTLKTVSTISPVSSLPTKSTTKAITTTTQATLGNCNNGNFKCFNGGICGAGGTSCICPAGWLGPFCQTPASEAAKAFHHMKQNNFQIAMMPHGQKHRFLLWIIIILAVVFLALFITIVAIACIAKRSTYCTEGPSRSGDIEPGHAISSHGPGDHAIHKPGTASFQGSAGPAVRSGKPPSPYYVAPRSRAKYSYGGNVRPIAFDASGSRGGPISPRRRHPSERSFAGQVTSSSGKPAETSTTPRSSPASSPKHSPRAWRHNKDVEQFENRLQHHLSRDRKLLNRSARGSRRSSGSDSSADSRQQDDMSDEADVKRRWSWEGGQDPTAFPKLQRKQLGGQQIGGPTEPAARRGRDLGSSVDDEVDENLLLDLDLRFSPDRKRGGIDEGASHVSEETAGSVILALSKSESADAPSASGGSKGAPKSPKDTKRGKALPQSRKLAGTDEGVLGKGKLVPHKRLSASQPLEDLRKTQDQVTIKALPGDKPSFTASPSVDPSQSLIKISSMSSQENLTELSSGSTEQIDGCQLSTWMKAQEEDGRQPCQGSESTGTSIWSSSADVDE